MASSSPRLHALPLRQSSQLGSGDKVCKDYQFLALGATKKKVTFHHPGYPPQDDTLFSLYAWDAGPSKPGINFGLAHNVCVIIADNRADGYLSTSREDDAAGKIALGVDDILPAGDYWFFVPNLTVQSGLETHIWPVVSSFQEWDFPTNSLPESWARIENRRQDPQPPLIPISQSAYSIATRSRDRTCRITNHTTATHVAHLCPTHVKKWFVRNDMQNWNYDSSLDANHLLDDLSNTLLLRADLHEAFDARRFVFFPKTSDGFVVHMLQSTPDIGQLYHNTLTHDIEDCSIQFLYARFAWAIFPFLVPFLNKTTRRVVGMRDQQGVRTVEDRSGDVLGRTATLSRSANTKKRSRNASQDTGQDIANDQYHTSAISPFKRRRTSQSHSSPTESRDAESSVLPTEGTFKSPVTQFYEVHTVGDSPIKNSDDSKISVPDPLIQEDIKLQQLFDNAIGTGMHDLLLPPSRYPGWRRIERMRQDALAKQRPAQYRSDACSPEVGREGEE